ncbi:MAG: DUF4113 domain-containing protein [Comamonadaceae bacterium]|nr:DUF4113 domain-containing protein [Comamonadaceae bacterium]
MTLISATASGRSVWRPRGGRSWQMRRGNLSPGYTTSWDGLPVARAGRYG